MGTPCMEIVVIQPVVVGRIIFDQDETLVEVEPHFQHSAQTFRLKGRCNNISEVFRGVRMTLYNKQSSANRPT